MAEIRKPGVTVAHYHGRASKHLVESGGTRVNHFGEPIEFMSAEQFAHELSRISMHEDPLQDLVDKNIIKSKLIMPESSLDSE